MRSSAISTAILACGQVSLVLAMAVETESTDLEFANVTETGELSGWLESLETLQYLALISEQEEDDDGDDDHTTLGDKVPGENFLTLCQGDHTSDSVQINKVDLSPPMPIKGESLAIDGAGKVTRQVEAGTTVHVEVRLAGVRIYKHNFDLCKEVGKVGGGCPFTPSPLQLAKSYNIPKALPKGRYQFLANVVGADKTSVTCVEGKMKL